MFECSNQSQSKLTNGFLLQLWKLKHWLCQTVLCRLSGTFLQLVQASNSVLDWVCVFLDSLLLSVCRLTSDRLLNDNGVKVSEAHDDIQRYGRMQLIAIQTQVPETTEQQPQNAVTVTGPIQTRYSSSCIMLWSQFTREITLYVSECVVP